MQDFVFPLFPPPEYFEELRILSAINQGARMGWKTSGINLENCLNDGGMEKH
jgi:hypothetical protein